MKRSLFVALGICLSVAAACAPPRPSPVGQALPSGAQRSARLIVSSDALWAGYPAGRTVSKLKLPNGQVVWRTILGCEPATLTRQLSRLFVACPDSGEVVALNENTGRVLARRRVGHAPFGLVGTPNRLFVSLTNDDVLVALNPRSLTEIQRVATGRQPKGLALAADRLYVVHLLDASVHVFDAPTLNSVAQVVVGLQAALAESITVAPAIQRAYVPHQRMNVTNLARTFDSTVFPLVTAVDMVQLAPVRREALALDSVDTPVGMPAAAVVSADGRRLYVANAASDDVSVIDLSTGIGVGHVVVGGNPRDLTLSPDGTRLYTLNNTSGDITGIDTAGLMVVATLPLGPDLRADRIRLGERLFFTSRPRAIARDHWMACASCHFDAGFDGQTWLGNDGGPRNTTVLRGLRDTEPFHWSADRADIPAFQATFKELLDGTGLSEQELDALSAFLHSLAPLASPARLSGGALTPAARRGSQLFRQAGCTLCHTPPHFTDRQLHDVGTGQSVYTDVARGAIIPETMGTSFDTPSLRELWLTAPYLHDGRAPTLHDLLVTYNPTGRHGSTNALSSGELADLEAFLRSLPLTAAELKALFGA